MTWCHDTARDAAVRAAEDGRNRPLPTPGEAIAAVTESMSGNAGGEEMEQGNFADAAERSSTVSKTGDEQSGLRTERVAMERDAAIRERDELRKSWLRSEESGTRLLAERNAALDAADGLRKQVAELKDQSHARWVSMNKYLCELSETRCERDEVKARVAELEAASGGGEKKPMRMPSREWFARMADVDEANISVGGLASRVAEVEAASGAEQEPVAWGATRDSGSIADAGTSRREMEHVSGMMGGTVVPLYRSPPQPRGWLTGEEREAVETARDHFDNDDLGDSECVFIARMMKQILARSTPPEVVLPDWVKMCVSHGRQNQLLAALAAAGVAVKEVQR